MKALKIAGLVLVAVWILWVSDELIRIRGIALEACALAASGPAGPDGGIHVPVTCPALNNNEVQ
jgi:hypothetical protein